MLTGYSAEWISMLHHQCLPLCVFIYSLHRLVDWIRHSVIHLKFYWRPVMGQVLGIQRWKVQSRIQSRISSWGTRSVSAVMEVCTSLTEKKIPSLFSERNLTICKEIVTPFLVSLKILRLKYIWRVGFNSLLNNTARC